MQAAQMTVSRPPVTPIPQQLAEKNFSTNFNWACSYFISLPPDIQSIFTSYKPWNILNFNRSLCNNNGECTNTGRCICDPDVRDGSFYLDFNGSEFSCLLTEAQHEKIQPFFAVQTAIFGMVWFT